MLKKVEGKNGKIFRMHEYFVVRILFLIETKSEHLLTFQKIHQYLLILYYLAFSLISHAKVNGITGP